ncbi:MAG: hypothetical protein OEY38_06865 [Gammaproteobacteria bacterium]|nr:hypothetical protein [Gammaproteobacteria bacterium]
MKKIKLLALLIAVVLLIGCASGAKFENMAYTETSKFKYEQALKKEIGLSGVDGGEKTNPLWTSEISNEAFQEALKLSLTSQGLMSENGRYQLKVNLVKVDQPLFGLDLKVTTHVNYILTDTKTNKVVLDELVVAPFTATFGDAAIAIKRLRLANEGSGKNNIKGFLEKLSLLNVSAISLAN